MILLGVTPNGLRERLINLIDHAVAGGAKAILFACSAYGPVVDDIRNNYNLMFQKALCYLFIKIASCLRSIYLPKYFATPRHEVYLS
jgi:hypothetical protein